MLLQDSENKRKRFRSLFISAVVVIFVIAFRHEFMDLLQFLFLLIKVYVLRFPFEPPDPTIVSSLLKLGYNLFLGFGLVFILWLLLFSEQALLPVGSLQDIQRTAWHLLLFILRKHGQAVFVKDGVPNTTDEDRISQGPGLVVVDFNSAVVLEERLETPGLTRPFTEVVRVWLSLTGFSDPRESPRACGPGIVFTHWNEIIRGVVDLRKQFRILTKIPCYTREGIELIANVWSIFTIGQDPDVLDVTFIGEHKPENLRVVRFEYMADGRIQVKEISDELDEDDRLEIYRYSQSLGAPVTLLPMQAIPPLPLTPVFDRERVFAAVFSQARAQVPYKPPTNEAGAARPASQPPPVKEIVLPWTELPARVASDIYRRVLSQINYDELYDIKGNGSFPLPKHKSKLKILMRNCGILSYRMVFHHTGRVLARGAVYPAQDMVASQVQPLRSPKVLRDRGIKVLMSGFSDPTPVSEAVYKSRLDSWRARWESDLEITRATRELEAMRVRSRARAQAQKDLAYSLARVFEAQENSDEAVAIRIMQALERAATDPKTRQLLPGNTIDLMRMIQTLLLPMETARPPAPRTPTQEN